MTVIETLTQRNEAFASSRFSADLKIMPSMKTMIIGCVPKTLPEARAQCLTTGEHPYTHF
jgi:carbonic anhydrase